jgi:hypothetical protein
MDLPTGLGHRVEEISQTELRVVYLQFLAYIFPVRSHGTFRDVQLLCYPFSRYAILDEGGDLQLGK